MWILLLAYAIAQVFGCCYLVSIFSRWLKKEEASNKPEQRLPLESTSINDRLIKELEDIRKELDATKKESTTKYNDEMNSSSCDAEDPHAEDRQLSEIIANNKREHDRIEEERRRRYERGIDFDKSIERCKRWIPDADVKIRSVLHQYAAFGRTTPFYWISESDYIKITDEMWTHMTGFTARSPFDRPDGKVGEYHCTPVYCVRGDDVAWLKRQSTTALP